MAESYSTVWMDPVLFIHSSIDGYLGYFHLLVIMGGAAMNTHVHVFVSTPVVNCLG